MDGPCSCERRTLGIGLFTEGKVAAGAVVRVTDQESEETGLQGEERREKRTRQEREN